MICLAKKISLNNDDNTLVVITDTEIKKMHFKDVSDKEQVKYALKRELAGIVDQVKALKNRAEEIKELLAML